MDVHVPLLRSDLIRLEHLVADSVGIGERIFVLGGKREYARAHNLLKQHHPEMLFRCRRQKSPLAYVFTREE